MPNRKAHSVIGSASGTAFYLIESYKKEEDFHLGDCIAAALGGLLGGIIPDYLDPPNNPNHRKFAHSVLLGAGSTLNIEKIFKWVDSLDIYDFWKWLLKGLIFGYLSHLALDLGTPKGLPLI